MILELFHVDAFASRPFEGNPAAVCILNDWLPDAIMQAIAAELNLSETAFVVKREDGDYRIRWFAPKKEVSLCGHATLASAHVLYEHHNIERQELRFHSLSGLLSTHISDAGITMNFPTASIKNIDVPDTLIPALNARPLRCFESEDLIAIFSDPSEISIIEPNFNLLNKLPYRGICITAPGNGGPYDFVCRFFAPSIGINEDPVTGSAYTKLAPIYTELLHKQDFFAKQVSQRGGELEISLKGSRTHITGKALTLMRSQLTLPDFN